MSGKRRTDRPPLTPAQRAAVERWMRLGAFKALKSARMTREDAEDAISEAWLQMCLSVRTYDAGKGTAIGTHLGNAAHWAARSAHRDRIRQGFGVPKRLTAAAVTAALPRQADFAGCLTGDLFPAPDQAGPPDPDPRLAAALATLPPKLRAAVVARYMDGKTLDEIGRPAGVTRECARLWVAAGLDRLRAYFGVCDGH